MGQKSTYKCSACDYSVMTSAGLDYGMLAVVETHICKNCRIIVDICVGEYGKVFSREELEMHSDKNNPEFDYYKCPICGDDKALVKWDKRKRPCPKCDGTMKIDKSAGEILWD